MPERSRKPKRPALVIGDAVHIPLTKGLFAIVDLVDGDLAEFNWHAQPHDTVTYAVRRLPGRREDPRDWVRLHAIIGGRMGLDLSGGREVDHRDNDGLNCRRSNLRASTRSQNLHNTRLRRDNSSGVKGVSWFRPASLWVVQIRAQGKPKIHKYFSSFEDAVAFNVIARKGMHGDFGKEACK